LRQLLASGAFGDAGEQEREPADQDVSADAVLEPAEDGPQQQLDGLLVVQDWDPEDVGAGSLLSGTGGGSS
jgi:hypothetical protein